jgi:two-component system sensor histidine kinase BaeS
MNRLHFDRLHVKLFAVIAGAISALTLGAYLVFTASFEQGFVQYLNRADEAHLALMIDRLEEGYARERGWSWIATDRQRWIEMSRDALGLARPSVTSGEAAATRLPPRETPLTIDPRLMLFDAERKQLIGRSEAAARAVLKPIMVDGVTAGYLGYVPRPDVIESIERVYLQRQRIAFGVIAIGMLAASLLLAAGLAYWLTRRIRALARGAEALIRGNYEVRLDVPGHDELARLAADFNTLAAAAAARSARQHWIADIAHELRTPLAAARRDRIAGGRRGPDQAAIGSLANETQRLARLVEDLRTLSLSDLGALSYHKELVDVAGILGDAVEAQQHAIDESGLKLELQAEKGAMVLADPARLTQVFTNLMQNSLRYTDAPGKVAVRLRRDGARVIVDWEDSSPGVPAEALARLTERLFRVEGSRSRDGGGSGLGLAIARSLVEGHGGTLAARPSPLGGLWVELAFPAASRE